MKRLLLLSCLLGAQSASALPPDPVSLIDREVDKLVALHRDGFAYSDAKMRRLIFGPLFDANRRDAVAFFSLAGVDDSNVHVEYIAIFAQGKGRDMSDRGGPKERPYHLVASAAVGMRGSRTLDWSTAKIVAGKITVQGKRWTTSDAACCPSKPIEVVFALPQDFADALPPDRYPVLREHELAARVAGKKTENGDR